MLKHRVCYCSVSFPGLWSVIVPFPDHTHLLFGMIDAIWVAVLFWNYNMLHQNGILSLFCYRTPANDTHAHTKLHNEVYVVLFTRR